MEPVRRSLLRALDTYIAGWLPARPTVRIPRSPKTALPNIAPPRLWLLLRGGHVANSDARPDTDRVASSVANRVANRVVAPLAVAIAGGAGWRPDHGSDYDLLGVVFHHGFTRVLRRRNRGRVGWQSVADWLHLSGAGHRRERALLRAWHEDGDVIADAAIMEALLSCVRHRLATTMTLDETADATRYRDACAYIAQHYGEGIDRSTVAHALGMHPNSLSRVFRRHGEESSIAFIRRLRLERAVGLLRASPPQSIASVARACGYAGADQFIRDFRHVHGCTPGIWRRTADC